MEATLDSRALSLTQSFGVAAALIVAAVLSTWVVLKRSGEVETLVMPDLSRLTAPARSVPPVDEEATWVQFGEEAYAAGRITEPEADNALYYFQKALAASPESAEAQAGIGRVVSRLESSTESAIFRGDWSEARSLARQLGAISSDSDRADAMLERVNRFERIDGLNARADRQVAAGRFTVPEGNNALESFRQILTIDPENEAAQNGIRSIAQRLLGFAQTAALAGEQEKAEAYVVSARSIDPQAEGLREAQQLVAQWSEMVNNKNIKEQLEAASAALERGHLVAPHEPNALAMFDRVLELDPGSEAARQGRRLVGRALVEQSWSQVRAGDFDGAEDSIVAARETGVESSALVELEQELEIQQILAGARRGQFDRMVAPSELEIRRRELPEYPKGANGDGWVALHFTVSESGDVIDVEVVESSAPVFEAPAIAAIERWRFKPYLLHERPIPVRVGSRIVFKI